MTTVPVADARANLSRLIDEAASTHERFEITRNGRRAAVLLGADDYDALRETIAVLSDSSLLQAHVRGLAEVETGESLDAEGLADAMRSGGRLSHVTAGVHSTAHCRDSQVGMPTSSRPCTNS